MAIQRIDNFDIARRHLFSGIYGQGIGDVFIDDDLRVYGIYDALYRSFKRQGYTVVFYSQASYRNFFSFRKEDLAIVYNLSPSHSHAGTPASPDSPRRYVANIDSPFGRRRKAAGGGKASQPSLASEEPEYDQIQTAGQGEHTFYRIADSVDPFSVVTNYIHSNFKRKVAFVFVTGLTDKYDEEQIGHINSVFEDFGITAASHGLQARIVVLYNCARCSQIFVDGQDTYFTSKHFRNKFLDSESVGHAEGVQHPSFDLYEIPGADMYEFRNLLNRQRLKDGLDVFSLPGGLNNAAVSLSQEIYKVETKSDKGKKNPSVEQLVHYLDMPTQNLYDMIEKMNAEKAMNQLKSLKGMDTVLVQLENFINALKFAKENPSGPRFRPHLLFVGNPGTGKTTVARLLAKILREEGLLERGHLVEATVGDLEGEYIGQTRVKTQALCDRARGGVLFIDEAYGLMSGSNGGEHADYGKEAIEVLIQFMENYSDSLVILGGYKADMENLIQNGNQGFMRRFSGEESFICFNDYDPDALYAIFRSQIKGMETKPEFDTAIKNIINYQYAHRTVRWGNAGEMENLASSIVRQRSKAQKTGPLEVADIPGHYMRVIAPVDTGEILKEIDELVGLDQVKQNLRTLLKACMGQRMRALRDPKAASEKRNLNFVFTGAPGTGKTTVACLMAKILYRAGIIDKSDEPVVVQKGDIIKSGVGDTPKAIKQLFMDHAGEVIFIDEAYGLTQHGSEAIDELTNCLTDPRFIGNQAVILAGYTQEMDKMLLANRGLRSRFEHIWLFEDYSNDELWTIFLHGARAKGMTVSDEEGCRSLASAYFDEERELRGLEFSNARAANQLFNIVSDNYDISEYEEGVKDLVIKPQHFPNYDAYDNK